MNSRDDFSTERLKEVILDLERQRFRERELKEEAQGVLTAMQALLSSTDEDEIFNTLLTSLRQVLQYEHAFILFEEENKYIVKYSTDDQFLYSQWAEYNFLKRVTSGKALLAFDISQIKEWQEQSEKIKKQVTSALHIPLTGNEQKAILIATHKERGYFSKKHQNLALKFTPIARQGLILLETNQKLQKETSERLKSEKEKYQMKVRMFQSYKLASIGELAAGVGHEINNPLAVINGYLDLIKKILDREGISNEQINRSLEKQSECVKRIVAIVNGLRTFARKDDDRYEAINLNDAVYNAFSFLKVIYEKEGINIRKIFDPQKLIIKGNVGKLQQAFVNLLSNARDATEGQNERRIVIRVRRQDDYGIIKISDNGKGIKPNDISRIYEQFFTTKEVGKGTGLGLAISKNIIESFEGTLKVISTEDVGTTFVITIPLIEEELKVIPEVTETELHPIHGKALVVDDEEELRHILHLFLTGFGLDVEVALDGIQALEMIQNNSYDYIITDLKMPRMNGDELVEEIRKLPSFKGKIFLITGATNHDTHLLQVDGILSKPFTEKELYEKLL